MISSEKLEELSKNIRIDVLEMTCKSGSGHPGGSLSCVDIFVALYFKILNHKPDNPEWEDRDRFILSKGHAAPAFYSILAKCGYISKNELDTLRCFGATLQGHPNRSLPGVEVSTGSLGQGLSIAAGVALSAKIDCKNYFTYVLLGDGECDEGQIWEAAMFASHNKLDNLIAIVDRNKFQIDDLTENVVALEPFSKKWESFGWLVYEVNGHNIDEIIAGFDKIKPIKGKPKVIIAHTIKGKGVTFMEGRNMYHGKCLTKEECIQACNELS
jgi:transketolase